MPPLHPVILDALVTFARPALRIHLALYRHNVHRAPFPRGDVDRRIPGPDPDHLLFVGDIAVSGYGVLEHGMSSSYLIAAATAQRRNHGVSWHSVTAPDLAIAQVARRTNLVTSGTDVVVLMLGIPDVLLGTRTGEWEVGLRRTIARIREDSGGSCAVVVAGIPPMADFQPINPVGRRIITGQVDRLNGVSASVAEGLDDVSFAAFPLWRIGSLFIRDTISWAAMHRLWAEELVPMVTSALDRVGAAHA